MARACLGVTALTAANSRADAAPVVEASKARQIPTARNVIYLYMTGGISHLDTFGVVPGADTIGPTRTIPTSADGVFVSEHLPRVARQMHHGVIINSMSSTQGAYEPGNYFAHTSYTDRGGTRHPSLGAWLTKFQGKGHKLLPGSVVITPDSRHPGAGFFEAAFAPLIIQDAALGLQNSQRLSVMSETDFDYRLALTSKLDAPFRAASRHPAARAHGDMYREAIGLMKSSDLIAFDLEAEPAEVRDAYGSDRFGQGCLLARRLVEHGVRFVEVTLGTWDTHVDNFLKVAELCASLDQALGALLNDMHLRGLLSETLIVLNTEFRGNGTSPARPACSFLPAWRGESS